MFPGQLRIVDWAGRACCWLRGNEGEVSLWRGTRFSVDLNDRIQRQMWCRSYEPQVTTCLASILRNGDTFLDVGAHIGYHSAFAAGVVGSGGRVFAFEPDPQNYARLVRNLEPYAHCKAFPNAVWEQETEMVFERSSDRQESGWGALTAVRRFGTGEEIRVQAISIDSFAQRFSLNAVRAIKIDTEGAELAVLAGARAAIQQFRPIIFTEVNPTVLEQAGTSAGALREKLLEYDYEIYEIAYKSLRRLLAG